MFWSASPDPWVQQQSCFTARKMGRNWGFATEWAQELTNSYAHSGYWPARVFCRHHLASLVLEAA